MQKNRLMVLTSIIFSASLIMFLANQIGQTAAIDYNPTDSTILTIGNTSFEQSQKNLNNSTRIPDDGPFFYDTFDDDVIDDNRWLTVNNVIEFGGKAILSTSGQNDEAQIYASRNNLIGLWVSAAGFQDIAYPEHVNIHLATETPAHQIITVGIVRSIYSNDPLEEVNKVFCQWFGPGVPEEDGWIELEDAQWGATYEFGLEYTASGNVLVWVNGSAACSFPAAGADVAYSQGSAPFWFFTDSVEGGTVSAEIDWAKAKTRALSEQNNRWHVRTIISSGEGVDGLDLALDNKNLPHIAYTTDNNDLLYTHFMGDEWINQTVSNEAGNSPDIAIDDSNTPHIGYGRPGPDVIYAKLDGNSWITDTVDDDMVVAPTLALDSSGNPHLAYQDVRPTHLPWARGIVYAYWTGSNWNTTVVNKNITGCEFDCDTVSLALDSSDSPHVAYRDRADNRIIYSVLDGNSWITKGIDVSSFGPQLRIDSRDVPHVVYTHDGPEAKYGTYDGSSWTTGTIDSKTAVWPSVAFDKFNRPHVAYCDVRHVPPGRGLKYAIQFRSGWVILEIDRVECDNVSLVIDSKGNPHIAYHDITNGGLKYATWRSSTRRAYISTAGGTLGSIEDQTSYVFPPNLFNDTVVITHTSIFPGSVPTHTNLTGIDHYFDVTAVFSNTNEVAEPVSGHTYTLTVSYEDEELTHVYENTLAFYYWNGSEWEKEESSTVNGFANQISATSDQFSLWGIFGKIRHYVYLPVILNE